MVSYNVIIGDTITKIVIRIGGRKNWFLVCPQTGCVGKIVSKLRENFLEGIVSGFSNFKLLQGKISFPADTTARVDRDSDDSNAI